MVQTEASCIHGDELVQGKKKRPNQTCPSPRPSPLASNRQRKPLDGLDPFSAVLEEAFWMELERRKGMRQLDLAG